MAEIEKHIWVNVWRECEYCNYDIHRCPFCGDGLDHEEYDTQGNHHTAEFCRPDLFEHEVGPLCTMPDRYCYWDHKNHVVMNHTEFISGNEKI